MCKKGRMGYRDTALDGARGRMGYRNNALYGVYERKSNKITWRKIFPYQVFCIKKCHFGFR